ncbi:FAD-linked oxidase C-terminal domain-containing protein [Methylobacterium oryzae CBMB20]
MALTAKYGGLLWGEHGKGFRSEFVPETFGPLMPALEAVKRAFDPDDRMNRARSPRRGAEPHPDRRRAAPGRAGPHHPGAGAEGFRRGAPLQRQWRLFQLRRGRGHVPVLEGDRGRRHSPEGRASLDARVAAPRGADGVDPAAELSRQHAGWLRDVAATLRSGFRRRSEADDFSTPSRRRWTAASPASPARAPVRSRSTCRPSGRSSWRSIHPLRAAPEGSPRGGPGAAAAAGGAAAPPEQPRS